MLLWQAAGVSRDVLLELGRPQCQRKPGERKAYEGETEVHKKKVARGNQGGRNG